MITPSTIANERSQDPNSESSTDASSRLGIAETGELSAQSLSVSEPYVGQWNTLISQTNWEKGRIISQWRTALVDSGATATEYSDDAWSRQVGSVTSQHVGRLRRVFERFAESYNSYTGLYWSHFLAAIDWDDAELWLEGAMRSGWSISEMRKTRWESAGGDPKHAPRDEELITTEVDEGFDALTEEQEEFDRGENDRIVESGPLAEGPDFGDSDSNVASEEDDDGVPFEMDSDPAIVDLSNPFASLPELPIDVADAMEQFKLCIVRHRAGQWSDISQAHMLDVLNALQTFVARS